MNFTVESILYPILPSSIAAQVVIAGVLIITIASPIMIGFWITWRRLSILSDAVLNKQVARSPRRTINSVKPASTGTSQPIGGGGTGPPGGGAPGG